MCIFGGGGQRKAVEPAPPPEKAAEGVDPPSVTSREQYNRQGKRSLIIPLTTQMPGSTTKKPGLNVPM